MPLPRRNVLRATRASRAPEIASFLAQLDDQSRRLARDTRGLAKADLAWQPHPGMNTIGMLLAHIAIVEVYWMQIGPLGLARQDSRPVLGIGLDDDGMPSPPQGRPPASLRGWTLARYDRLLARARAHTRRVAARLRDADLDRPVTRRGPRGVMRTFNHRWVFYHVLEHLAGHYGQILLLLHLRRARR